MRVSKATWALLLGAGLACGSGAALAQQAGVTKDQAQVDKSSADAHLQAMAKQLNLTDEQKEKLKPILTSEAEEITALRNGPALTPPQKRSKMMEIGEKYRPQINAVLTPEQQTKWKAMRQEMMEKHKAEGGGGMDHQ
jgi:Spy/CpxP family protein refolding chaperone